MKQSHFPLGTVIAERQIALYDQTGGKRLVAARLEAPVRNSFGPFLGESLRNRSSSQMERASLGGGLALPVRSS
jgi:hypothetical protein